MSTEWVCIEDDDKSKNDGSKNVESNLEDILLYNEFANNPESFKVNVFEFKIPGSEDTIYYCFKKSVCWTPRKKKNLRKLTCCTVCRSRLNKFCGYCANGNSLLLQNFSKVFSYPLHLYTTQVLTRFTNLKLMLRPCVLPMWSSEGISV